MLERYADVCAVASDIREYLPVLNAEVMGHPGCVAVEFGVRAGNSTVALLTAVEAVQGSLWSVDVSMPGGHAADLLGHPRWTFNKGSSVDPDLAATGPAAVDVLFIDTLHTYALTLDELTLWGPRVAAGGVILLHDTDLRDPRSTDPSLPEDVEYPVRTAAFDYMKTRTGLAWEEIPGQYGLGVIRVGV